MNRIWRHRPSPAMVVAMLALVLSLGGTAWALTLPAKSVGTKQLKANAVIGSKVKNGSLTVADLSEASLSKQGRVALNNAMANVEAGAQRGIAKVSLTVPKTGFVLVQGWVSTDGATGKIGVKVWDETADKGSPVVNLGSPAGGQETISNVAVFPVTAGARDFTVRLVVNQSTTAFEAYGTIAAQFIPYGATGSSTEL